MRGAVIETEIRHSCSVHASLLDSFIELTQAELAQHNPGFVEESLAELLESLRSERRLYGVIGGVRPVVVPAIENAA